MKIELKQKKLIGLLEKLSMAGCFPVADVTITNDKNKTYLLSIQKEAGARSIRFLKVQEQYFDIIEPSDEPFRLEVDIISKVIKNLPPEELITIQRNANKLSIKGNKIDLNLNYQPLTEPMETFNIKKKNGEIYIGKVDAHLDTHIDMPLIELRDIVDYAKAIDTTYYQLLTAKKSFNVRVGDIHALNNYIIINPVAALKKGDTLSVTFTNGINEISQTFTQKNITLVTGTDKPLLAQEQNEHYQIAVVIPPYRRPV